MREHAIIKQLSRDDWEAFRALDQIIFSGDEMDEESFLKRAEQDGSYVLYIDDRLAGHLIVSRFGSNEAHLGRIGVAPEYQGKGYGNLLMEHALHWLNAQVDITAVHLYTQQDNHTAQSLYKKFGFVITGTTWHHFVPYDSLRPHARYSCQEIEEHEIGFVGEKYPNLPVEQIRQFIDDERSYVMTLKDESGDITGACRFSPSFPGCFPFILDIPQALDDFLVGLKPVSLPKFDYVRITYTDMPEVAKICEERGYKLHHKLFKFTLFLRK
ncbi:MAG: GNAT family N-acetyltransferase [Candidatus Thorarchaeota archaeon]